MKKSRNGKYKEYEKRILRFLVKQKYDVTAGQIRRNTNIPKSSCYDVLDTLRNSGYIEWIGEFQDAISMVMITSKGKNHLKRFAS